MNSFHNLLNPILLQEMARNWIKEDLSSFDIQAIVAEDKEVVAKILCKSNGVLSGIPFVNSVLNELNCSPNWFFKEGEYLEASPVCEVAYVGGKARNVLLSERIVLNVMARCSGVATQARYVRQKLEEIGWKGMIAGTRKTTPGFRLVEKYGLIVGGVTAHRFDLSDMVMIKDNHISIAGSVAKALADVRKVKNFVQKIEVECRNLEEAEEASRLGADIIMLDNFDAKSLHRTADYLKAKYSGILVEASGGITTENVIQYARESVDIISLSCLVQGYPTVDFSMKVLTSE